jgi:hypothetical protein
MVYPADNPASPARAIVSHAALLADLDGDAAYGRIRRQCEIEKRTTAKDASAVIIDRSETAASPAAELDGVAPGLGVMQVSNVLICQIGHSIPRHCAGFPAAAAERSYTVEEDELCDRLPQKLSPKRRSQESV